MKETVTILDNSFEEKATCPACEQPLQAGDKVVRCPRCKALHHFACWIGRGSCSTLGCRQLADPSLMPDRPRRVDPQVKDNLLVPKIATVAALLLVIGGLLWSIFGPNPPSESRLIILTKAGDYAMQLVKLGEEFAAGLEELDKVDVVAVPTESPFAEAQNVFDQKMVLMIVGKEPPDIVVIPRSKMNIYVQNEALQPLDDLRAALLDTPVGSLLERGEIDGHLYGVPSGHPDNYLCLPTVAQNSEPARRFILYLAEKLPWAEEP